MKRTERQAHGFIFQDWVVGRFLDMAYTAEWDIPKKINNFSHKNISIKTAKWKGSVGLGDALNQFKINEDFEMLIAFYKIENNRKRIINMQLLKITREKWMELWGDMTQDKLEKLISLIKSDEGKGLKGEKLDEFRKKIKQEKSDILKDYTGRFSLHQKIDSKIQRRLQCSLSFGVLFEEFGLNKRVMKKFKLWGQEISLSNIRID